LEIGEVYVVLSQLGELGAVRGHKLDPGCNGGGGVRIMPAQASECDTAEQVFEMCDKGYEL